MQITLPAGWLEGKAIRGMRVIASRHLRLLFKPDWQIVEQNLPDVMQDLRHDA